MQDAEVHTNSYLRPRWPFASVEDGLLHIDGKSVEEIARKYGTPFYMIIEKEVRSRLKRFRKAFAYRPFQPQYAVKCNSNPAILQIIREEGFEADTSSMGEIMLALKAGFRPDQITLTNQYKSPEELHLAISLEIKALGIDSLEDLEDMVRMAETLNKEANIFLRINANIRRGEDYDTSRHQYGIPLESAEEAIRIAAREKHTRLAGLHWHGAYVPEPGVYLEALRKITDLAEFAKRAGNPLEYLDFGGGFPAEYGDEKAFTPEEVGESFSRTLERIIKQKGLERPTLIFEPGKFIVANAGLAVFRVVSFKNFGEQKILISDGGTYNMLPDPLIWDCYYHILPASRMDEAPDVRYAAIKGNTCDHLDSIAKGRMLPPLRKGDLLVATDCGAYSNVMASNFNGRKIPPMLMLRKDGEIEMIRRPQTYEELFSPELDREPREDDRLVADILREHLDDKLTARRLEHKGFLLQHP